LKNNLGQRSSPTGSTAGFAQKVAQDRALNWYYPFFMPRLVIGSNIQDLDNRARMNH